MPLNMPQLGQLLHKLPVSVLAFANSFFVGAVAVTPEEIRGWLVNFVGALMSTIMVTIFRKTNPVAAAYWVARNIYRWVVSRRKK